MNLGLQWRKLWLTGTSIETIAQSSGENSQVIRRSIWLAKIPEDIKVQVRSHPEIFTRAILVDTFAAKRRQCEKDGFSLLRIEVVRMVHEGAGSKPKLKTNKKQKKKITRIGDSQITQKPSKIETFEHLSVDPTYHIEASIEAEYLIKQALGYHCRVAFDKNGGGEVRIFFKDKKSLEGLIETFEPLSKDLF
ncbi:MAG: hypothetical protein V4591_04340 [Bdellovibrionota bacterium]